MKKTNNVADELIAQLSNGNPIVAEYTTLESEYDDSAGSASNQQPEEQKSQ